MRWIFLVSGLLLAAPAAAQENEAEKLFRTMEKKVRAAKSLEVVLEGTATQGDGKDVKWKGKLLVGDGNRFRMETEADADGKKHQSLLASDGKLVYSKGVSSATWPAHAENAERVRAFFARAGLSACSEAIDPESGIADLDKAFAAADFKLGAKEKIAGKDAQLIEYTLTVAKKGGKRETVKMAVWIDAQTQLPLKRRLDGKEGDMTITVVETYSTLTLDAKIDAKVFELPK
jgi:outer membrane lipoprotein-sorting protein